MPAIITHDFFGQDIYDRLFREIGGTRDVAEAFLLGNQGPDPLFYSLIIPSLREHNRLGSIMHSKKPSSLMVSLKNSLSILSDDELPLGRAYALGFLCHYTLDSTMHPFVYSQEYQLCDAGEPGLSRADANEVHSVIETELDELVLFHKRGQTVASFAPWSEILQANNFTLETISKMYAYVALVTYGLIIPQDMFTLSVRSFRKVQRLFHSPKGIKRTAFARFEETVRPYSFFQSMSHRALELTQSAFDNHAHRLWESPFTGQQSHAGFWDLYKEALNTAEANIALFDCEDFDMAAAQKLTGELDFSGRPVVATLVSVKESPLSKVSPAASPAQTSA